MTNDILCTEKNHNIVIFLEYMTNRQLNEKCLQNEEQEFNQLM
jgi:hypothetical protein